MQACPTRATASWGCLRIDPSPERHCAARSTIRPGARASVVVVEDISLFYPGLRLYCQCVRSLKARFLRFCDTLFAFFDIALLSLNVMTQPHCLACKHRKQLPHFSAGSSSPSTSTIIRKKGLQHPVDTTGDCTRYEFQIFLFFYLLGQHNQRHEFAHARSCPEPSSSCLTSCCRHWRCGRMRSGDLTERVTYPPPVEAAHIGCHEESTEPLGLDLGSRREDLTSVLFNGFSEKDAGRYAPHPPNYRSYVVHLVQRFHAVSVLFLREMFALFMKQPQ